MSNEDALEITDKDMPDNETIQADCIRELYKEITNSNGSIKVASIKELLSLLNAKDNMNKEKQEKERPLFGDIFQWRKPKEI